MIKVKICGVKTIEAAKAAIEAGADFIGFVFYPASPRFLDPMTAKNIMAILPSSIKSVGLFVDPDDEKLQTVLDVAPLDMLQLHGHETVERVAAIKHDFALPVIKSISIGDKDDVAQAQSYEAIADWLLLDAKSAGLHHNRPGGNGVAFDWRLLDGVSWQRPWLLAGGLTPSTVAEAIRTTGATAVDVSSGVEDSPGQKNAALIREFVTEARTAG